MPIIGIMASAISGNLGLSVDYLVVAGGGGGGQGTASDAAGGGGAGGLRSTVTATGGGGSLESALVLDLDTSYTVTVVAAVQVAQEATLQQEKELTVLIQYFQQLLPQAVAVRVAFQLQVILAVLVVVMALKHQEAVRRHC
jgi:hypothetical protein